jgi:hypothetical protein
MSMLKNGVLPLFLIIFTILTTGCTYKGIKQIEEAHSIQYIIATDGTVVNSSEGVIEGNSKEGESILEWFNGAEYLSEENDTPEDLTLPFVEQLSNSNFLIYTDSQNIIHLIYKEDNIFKVVHEGGRAYYIKSPKLFNYLQDNMKGS